MRKVLMSCTGDDALEPWMNTSDTPQRRASLLLANMSLAEKVKYLYFNCIYYICVYFIYTKRNITYNI